MPRRLTGSFYRADTLSVARQLLGKLLVRSVDGQRLSGIIVESEAYLAQDDPASHSHRGPGRRNASMFTAPGHLYVYTIHAKCCLNVVTAPEGVGEAVLVRALEPWEGIDTMRHHRGLATLDPTAKAWSTYRDLSAGPGRLCQALQIDRALDGVDLPGSDEVWIEDSPSQVVNRPFTITATPRIGISSARESLYRFFIDGHQCVSGLARHHTTRRSWIFSSRAAGSILP